VFPDFGKVISKALEFTENLMLFLPRNTSIEDLTSRLMPFKKRLIGKKRRESLKLLPNYQSELCIEVEELTVGSFTKAIVVYTGDLANI
jgi:hypothetical protein